MNNFKIGDRVVFVKEGELVYGTIRTIVDSIGMAIVASSEVIVDKVPLSQLALAPANSEVERVSEPVEKSEITLTPTELKNAVERLSPDVRDEYNPAIEMMFLGFGFKLYKALFLDEFDND